MMAMIVIVTGEVNFFFLAKANLKGLYKYFKESEMEILNEIQLN